MTIEQTGFRDGVGIRGVLTVRVRDAKTGAELRHFQIRNKITFLMADVLVELVAQRATDPQPLAGGPPFQTPGMIYSMRMGTSNTAPSRADVNLGAYVIGVQLLDVNKVTGVPWEIDFTATLGAGDANGNTLQEAGLFTRGGAATAHPVGVDVVSDTPTTFPGDPRLVAHQVHPPIPKTIAITVEYSWRIAFTA